MIPSAPSIKKVTCIRAVAMVVDRYRVSVIGILRAGGCWPTSNVWRHSTNLTFDEFDSIKKFDKLQKLCSKVENRVTDQELIIKKRRSRRF